MKKKKHNEAYLSGYEDCLIKYSELLINELSRCNSVRREKIAKLKKECDSLKDLIEKGGRK